MLSTGLFLVLIAAVLTYYLVRYTTLGYEWRVIGSNQEFARYGGVDVQRKQLLSMLIGGALAGLAGAILVLGVHRRFIMNISKGLGFTGVLTALIAANSPILVIVLAAVFGTLVSGTLGMESRIGVPVELSDIVQSVIIFLVIARAWMSGLITRLFQLLGRRSPS